MPIEEEILDSTIQDIRHKLGVNSLERQKIKNILQAASSIQQIDVPDPTKEKPRQTKKELPKDRILGTEISPTRRQAIYDKIRQDVSELG